MVLLGLAFRPCSTGIAPGVVGAAELDRLSLLLGGSGALLAVAKKNRVPGLWPFTITPLGDRAG